MRLMLADVLRYAGFQVFEAAEAHEAISILECMSDVDVVITDMRMRSSQDGLNLARYARAHCPGVSLVLASSNPPPLDTHCLTRNVTEEVPADDWGGVTELGRCRRWREGSAWARGARCCRRWRSATGRPSGRRRGASSMSCARRPAGIASMRCGHFGNARLSSRARSRHRESAGAVRRDDQRCADGVVGGVGSGVRQAAQGDDPDPAAGA